ncbi:MAG: 4Fe-4S binding protein [Planctomycetes bacterium]|nr:4Fe-4S binding protein [Planctomycetota bacterium]
MSDAKETQKDLQSADRDGGNSQGAGPPTMSVAEMLAAARGEKADGQQSPKAAQSGPAESVATPALPKPVADRAAPAAAAGAQGTWRINLFETVPLLKRIMKLRSFQFLVVLPNVLVFYLFFAVALFGNPMGNQNLMIMIVWILWWFVLIVFLVPFGSRVWCTVCPLPFFGDWIQRRELVRVRPGKTGALKNEFHGGTRPWPKKLRNIWMQNIGFLAMALFSALLVTRPMASLFVFALMVAAATIFAMIWRLRAFCNYLCPISGFLSLYAMTATLELRHVDGDVCLKCKDKSCLTGSENGWACPWGVYVGKLDRNNYCGLCMECVKSCPSDNISLFLRPFGTDIHLKHYDEAWKAFIMLVLAMVYSITLLGPYGWVKDLANVTWTGNVVGFLLYSLCIILACLVVLPIFHLIAISAGRALAWKEKLSRKKLFIGYAYTLVPLGLFAWIAFSFPLLLVNGSYILQVVSDPFGWGWDLFGTAEVPWTPILPDIVPYIQTVIMMIGLLYAIVKGYEVARSLYQERQSALWSFAPTTVYLCILTSVFLVFFTG